MVDDPGAPPDASRAPSPRPARPSAHPDDGRTERALRREARAARGERAPRFSPEDDVPEEALSVPADPLDAAPDAAAEARRSERLGTARRHRDVNDDGFEDEPETGEAGARLARAALAFAEPDNEPDDAEADGDGPEAGPDAVEQAPSAVELFDADASPLAIGRAVIGRYVKIAPKGPGVYRMFNKAGEVLYVGKAKSVTKRISAYARGQAHTNRVARMIAETASMEFVSTATETEALLLEANLIKQLRPRYNVLLRDDKSFPFILISGDHEAPQLGKWRGARTRPGSYFGPFAGVWAVNRTLAALQRAFLLRVCSDSYYESRTRPCLLHQIKRCSGPCTGEISTEAYARLVADAKRFLSGKSDDIKGQIQAQMREASEALEFERAGQLRDRLAALSAVTGTQGINPQTVKEADVFALHEEAGHVVVEAFFFRNGQNWGNHAFYPKADRTLTAAEVLGAFLLQFYDDKPPPELILLSHEVEDAELVEAALSTSAGGRVELAVPKRGERRELVLHALRNAREALGRKLADGAAQAKLMVALQEAFGLDNPPKRVEVYDNSHIMGTNAVGAMVVAGPHGFVKGQYRTFNIKSDAVTPGDDYGMMREVLTRRFGRLVREAPREDEHDPGADPADENAVAPDAFPTWPDLVLIDGGRGQLEAARAVLAELGVANLPLVAVAKGPDRNAGRETFFMPGREPIRLGPRDPALYFVQRLRDEAHRFAIGAHRAKRKRAFTKSALDEIPGIGPTRKRALLLHFGTMKAVERASFEDLLRAPGVNRAVAEKVYNHFHER